TAEWTLAKVREHARVGLLIDAFADPAFCIALTRCASNEESIPFAGGELQFQRTDAFPELPDLQPHDLEYITPEPTNTSVILNDVLFLKAYRLLTRGPHPDIEMTDFLTRAGFKQIAALAAAITHVAAQPTVI